MPFSAIFGQKTATQILTRALARGRVHHAYRFEGPAGVGKELAAWGLARSLTCSSPLAGLACLGCSACHRARKLTDAPPHVSTHPDIILIERGLYAPKQLGLANPESKGISVEQIRRLVLTRAGFQPHEGRALVFIIRQAHELGVQAANALLKTLEEPSANTYFILLTDRPGQLLDTIRSRTLAVRFGPLADEELEQILERHSLPLALIPFANGSASAALELGEDEKTSRRQTFSNQMEAALEADDLAQTLSAVDTVSDSQTLRAHLVFLGQRLATSAKQLLQTDPRRAETYAKRYALVLTAIRDLERNGQPTLVLESALSRMRQV